MQRNSSPLTRPRISHGGSYASSRMGELRNRLYRSGALNSSRSAVSRQDAAIFDDMVVDVGPGKQPTFTEHLLARLEQHGVRRCLFAEEDITCYAVAPCVVNDDAEEHLHHTSTVADTPESREPYYYLCVPCECRLTRVSSSSADTTVMLQDVHDHVASAAHRRTASWMADPDIDETLGESPLIDHTRYTRIFVNGIPTLLSRRPGGGDMFYPLPHEDDRVQNTRVVRRAPVQPEEIDGAEGSEQPSALFPSMRYSSDTCLWYRPLTSSTRPGSLQVVKYTAPRRDDSSSCGTKSRHCQSLIRRNVDVLHVPFDEYEKHTQMNIETVPRFPGVFQIQRRRLQKHLLSAKKKSTWDDHACRTVYVQSKKPTKICLAANSQAQVGSLTRSQTSADRMVVEANGVYRIALMSSRDISSRASLDANALSLSAEGNATQSTLSVAPQLTRELLSQVSEYRPFETYYETDSSCIGSSDSGRGRSASRDHDSAE